MQGFDQISASASFLPRRPPTILVIFDSRPTWRATTRHDGRSSRFATRALPTNSLRGLLNLALGVRVDRRGQVLLELLPELVERLPRGFGSGHAPSPGGNSTSSFSQMVANAESRSGGRTPASSSAIMSGSPARARS